MEKLFNYLYVLSDGTFWLSIIVLIFFTVYCIIDNIHKGGKNEK